MKKNTVIFDLDGTLLNTLDDLADSTNFALKKFSYPTKTTEEVRSFVGNGVTKLIERAIPDGKLNPNFNSCLEIFKENYSKNMYNKTSPYLGIVEMLKTLRDKGCNIAVVSNKFDMAVKNLCEKYFENLVDVAIGEDEANGIKKKPAPDTIFKAMRILSVDKEDCIYVGDSEVDIQSAKNAEIPCVSVLWGFKNKDFLIQNGANIIVSSPEEIVRILNS
jgi:phosphoglycolate phosphatase